jgi:hypothetical protein
MQLVVVGQFQLDCKDQHRAKVMVNMKERFKESRSLVFNSHVTGVTVKRIGSSNFLGSS